ncbi:hypothetical protein D3C75_905420 [compost metagenome]
MPGRVFHVVARGAGVLQADHVGVLTLQPAEQAAFHCGLHTVHVDTDNPHKWPLKKPVCMIPEPRLFLLNRASHAGISTRIHPFRHRAWRTALRRVHPQVRAHQPLLLQCRAVQQRPGPRPARPFLRRSGAGQRHRLRRAVRPGLQGHPAGQRHRHRPGRAAWPRPALVLQPQGSQGTWRGRHPGGCAVGRKGADRRRRDHRRHGDPRGDADHPGAGRTGRRRADRAESRGAWPG